MRRFTLMLPVGVAGLLALAGFFVVASNAPASAYPTALQNFSAPTAWSEGCEWSQHCTYTFQLCVPDPDPSMGCEVEPGGTRCHDCII